MDLITAPAQQIGAAVGVLAAAVAAGLGIWRKVSKDRTEVAADTQQREWYERSGDLLQKLQERAERLQERNEKLVEENALLKADATRLRSQRDELERQVESMGRRLTRLMTPEQREVAPSDFMPFEKSGIWPKR